MRTRSFWIGIGLSVALTGAAAAQASIADLMKHEVNPAALAFWAGGNDPPENETPQAAQARWRAAEAAVRTLQAAGARMQAPPYALPGRWSEFAKLMADTAASAEPAIRARDADAAFEAGGRLYDSCNACHKAYAPARG
jgi:cytochrome c556